MRNDVRTAWSASAAAEPFTGFGKHPVGFPRVLALMIATWIFLVLIAIVTMVSVAHSGI